MAEIAARMRAKGVQWHITGIGMGVRTHKDPAVIRYLEGQLISCLASIFCERTSLIAFQISSTSSAEKRLSRGWCSTRVRDRA